MDSGAELAPGTGSKLATERYLDVSDAECGRTHILDILDGNNSLTTGISRARVTILHSPCSPLVLINLVWLITGA